MVDIYGESISGPGVTPGHPAGAIVPQFLADQSAMANFGKVLSFQGNKGMSRHIEAKTNNEIATFIGDTKTFRQTENLFLCTT